MKLNTKIPLVSSDGTLVTIGLGFPEAQFGDEVSVAVLGAAPQSFPSLFVAAVDSVGLQEVAHDVMALFGADSTGDFFALLNAAYGHALHPNHRITIYTLYDHPIEDLEWVAEPM